MGNQQLEALEKGHAHLEVLFSTITRSDTEQIVSNTMVERLYKTTSNALRTSASKSNRKTTNYSFLLYVILNRDFKTPASRNTERRNQL